MLWMENLLWARRIGFLLTSVHQCDTPPERVYRKLLSHTILAMDQFWFHGTCGRFGEETAVAR